MKPLSLLLVFVLMACALGAAEPCFGSLSYPVWGNLDPAEGTIICRFRLDEELAAGPGSWSQPLKLQPWNRFVVFRIETAPGHLLMAFWKPGHEHPGQITLSFKHADRSVIPPRDRNGRVSGHWKTGEIHSVAVTWNRDRQLGLWLDGSLIEQISCGNDVIIPLGSLIPDAGRLTFGAPGSSSAITLLAVHILDRPLTAETLQSAACLEPQPETLLLDTFTDCVRTPSGTLQTRATVISGYSGERGGSADSCCQPETTASGTALRLHTGKPQP